MNKETYGEIYLILQKMGKKYIDKIPRGIYNEIIYNMPEHMDNNKSISKDAIAFVAGLHYKYWTENEEQKRELIKIFKANQEKQKEKYDVNNMFKEETENANNDIEIKDDENKSLIKVEKWYEKIANIFKKIFKIRGRKN